MGWELTWARMWPSLKPTLSLQILLKTSAGTEKRAVLSRGTQYKWCDDWSTSSGTCCLSWPHCPQTSKFLQRAQLPISFIAIFFSGEGTAGFKRLPWCQHSFLQTCHLLLWIVLPTTFSVICFIMSQRPLHNAWFLWSWRSLGEESGKERGGS